MRTSLPEPIYIFSGLGADERAFQELQFAGLPVTFIKWVVPERNESIQQYATRLLDQIPTEKPILVGLSFGGMMALEVAKQIAPEKVILIASVKIRNERPCYVRWAGFLNLHRLLPARLLKRSNALTNWIFGVKTKADKLILTQIIADTDPVFLTWAIDQIVHWDNRVTPENLVHIHGTSDRVLPVSFVNCDLAIEGGGHLMTLTQPEAIDKALRPYL